MQPRTWLIDFEHAMIAGLNRVYPHIGTQGCYFHFCNAIQKWIQDHGLKETYEQDMDFALLIGQFKALAFVPVHLIRESFQLLVETIPVQYPQYVQMLEGFIDYMEVK